MKLVSLKIFIVIFFGLYALLMMVEPASAHRVNVFAWVEGDTIHVQSKFAGGKRVKAAKIVVLDPQGNELLSGITNEQGEFSFPIPMRTDLKIVLIAGQGHQAEWTIPAAEMKDLPLATDATAAAKAPAQTQKPTQISELSPGITQESPLPVVSMQELEAVVESVLDRKLKPISKMLVEAQYRGPTVGDILAGIGYILGLVGIAAYVHSRKKKE